MRAERAELTVGLVPQGGAFWIAGVLYLENIVRAALSLDAGRPEFCFIADAEHPLDSGSGLTLDVPVYFYTHRSHDRWSHAARNSVLSGRLPRSLETLASRLNLSVLFPLQIPPGERLPVPWIGWIPDFQHKRQPQFFSDVERAVRDSRFRRIVDEASHVIVSSPDAGSHALVSDNRRARKRFPLPDGARSVLVWPESAGGCRSARSSVEVSDLSEPALGAQESPHGIGGVEFVKGQKEDGYRAGVHRPRA
jgi:hypothetical protein